MAYSETKEIRLSELNAARQYDVIGLDALLAQAGYYTIKSVTPDGYAVLGYPKKRSPFQWQNFMPTSCSPDAEFGVRERRLFARR